MKKSQNIIREALVSFLNAPDRSTFVAKNNAEKLVVHIIDRPDSAEFFLKLIDACQEF